MPVRTAMTMTALAVISLPSLMITAHAQVSPDLVSRTALRVCSDPSNPPFSNRSREGFENKIAEIVADQLKEPVRYLWAPSGPGFVRNTLNSDLCDIVMGYAVGGEMVQSTNPYYRSTYVIATPKGSALSGIETLDDPKLKGHTLGVFAATPPVDILLAKGLMEGAKVYPLIVDHRFDSPLRTILDDLGSGAVEAAIVWGPLIGASVKASNGALVMTPLLKDAEKPGFSYRITFGIRHDEPDWKHKLEAVIRVRRSDIDKVLVDFNVPMIDDQNRLISAAQAESASVSTIRQVRERRGPDSQTPFNMPGPPPTSAQ